MTSFRFPPDGFGRWRDLDIEGRMEWLDLSGRRHFDQRLPVRTDPGRTVLIDGRDIDNVWAFYCAVGEAVNGTGGYFGWNMQAFDDCLFGGFGLEAPFTIVWTHASVSRELLGHEALIEYLDIECGDLDPELFAEGIKWRDQTRAAAVAGERTLLEEIDNWIRRVPARKGGEWPITLVYE